MRYLVEFCVSTVCLLTFISGQEFGEKLVKASKLFRRQAELHQLVSAAESRNQERFQRGYIVQQPLVLVHPTYNYPQPPPPPAHGYIYKKPTSTTTSTTPEPEIEHEEERGSQLLTPAPPQPSFPEKEFEQSPVEIDDKPDPWDIRDSVPGSPGDDYPVLGHIPKTNFICEGRIPGYYADPETKCQVFHRCSDCTDNVRLQMDSFLCPNGTQFNQEVLACDWWGNVHCNTATKFYSLNEELNTLGPDGKYLQLSGMRQAPPRSEKKLAPAIIPKNERRPLAPQYRSRHRTSALFEDHVEPQTMQKLKPTRTPILFNEFRKPIITRSRTQKPSRPAEPTSDEALDNPDYFNPDIAPVRTSDLNEGSDDYLSSNDQLQLRSNTQSIEDYLGIDSVGLEPQRSSSRTPSPLTTTSQATAKPRIYPSHPTAVSPPTSQNPSTFTSTPKPAISTSASTTMTIPTTIAAKMAKATFVTTTAATRNAITSTKPSKPEDEENELLPLIGLRRGATTDDDASPFIVNKEKPKRVTNVPEPGVVDRPPSPNSEFDKSYPTTEVKDEYIPPTTSKPAYLPPTSKPKLNYFAQSNSKSEFTSLQDSYLPPKTHTSDYPVVSSLPIYPGNPYLAAPLPQGSSVQPSTFNYVPLSTGAGGTQPLFILKTHVPFINVANSGFPTVAQSVANFASPSGGVTYTNFPTGNFFQQPYFG